MIKYKCLHYALHTVVSICFILGNPRSLSNRERLRIGNHVDWSRSTNARNTNESSSFPPSYSFMTEGSHETDNPVYFPNGTSSILDPDGPTNQTLRAFYLTSTNETSPLPPSYFTATNNNEAYTTVELPLNPYNFLSQILTTVQSDQTPPSYSSVTIEEETTAQIAAESIGNNDSLSQMNPNDSQPRISTSSMDQINQMPPSYASATINHEPQEMTSFSSRSSNDNDSTRGLNSNNLVSETQTGAPVDENSQLPPSYSSIADSEAVAESQLFTASNDSPPTINDEVVLTDDDDDDVIVRGDDEEYGEPPPYQEDVLIVDP